MRFAIIVGGTIADEAVPVLKELLAALADTLVKNGATVDTGRLESTTSTDLVAEALGAADRERVAAKARVKAAREAALAARDAAEKYTAPPGEPASITMIQVQAIREQWPREQLAAALAAEVARLDKLRADEAAEASRLEVALTGEVIELATPASSGAPE